MAILIDGKILERAIKTYGKAGQLTKAIEEMSELQKELCKAITEGTDANARIRIDQEMADVEIMLEQLKIIFDNRKMVDAWRLEKLLRLKDRMDREERRE